MANILVTFAANALLMLSPIAYELRNSDPNAPKHGMNFAVGGSGVFNPYGMLNLRGQIDQFESLTSTVYPKAFLQYSVVLLGIHGNDYGAYLAKGNPVSVSLTDKPYHYLSISLWLKLSYPSSSESRWRILSRYIEKYLYQWGAVFCL